VCSKLGSVLPRSADDSRRGGREGKDSDGLHFAGWLVKLRRHKTAGQAGEWVTMRMAASVRGDRAAAWGKCGGRTKVRAAKLLQRNPPTAAAQPARTSLIHSREAGAAATQGPWAGAAESFRLKQLRSPLPSQHKRPTHQTWPNPALRDTANHVPDRCLSVGCGRWMERGLGDTDTEIRPLRNRALHAHWDRALGCLRFCENSGADCAVAQLFERPDTTASSACNNGAVRIGQLRFEFLL